MFLAGRIPESRDDAAGMKTGRAEGKAPSSAALLILVADRAIDSGHHGDGAVGGLDEIDETSQPKTRSSSKTVPCEPGGSCRLPALLCRKPRARRSSRSGIRLKCTTRGSFLGAAASGGVGDGGGGVRFSPAGRPGLDRLAAVTSGEGVVGVLTDPYGARNRLTAGQRGKLCRCQIGMPWMMPCLAGWRGAGWFVAQRSEPPAASSELRLVDGPGATDRRKSPGPGWTHLHRGQPGQKISAWKPGP